MVGLGDIDSVLMNFLELARVIQDEAPDAIKPGEIKNQFGRKVAIVSSNEASLADAC
jgi:hypothetical protein